MDQDLTIYLDRLVEGKEQVFEDAAPCELFFTQEKQLRFTSPVSIKGKAYIATDHLVLDIYAKVNAEMPCIICNTHVPILLEMERQTVTIPLEEIKNKLYKYKDLVREELLLQLPQTKECKSSCPERENIKSYLTKDSSDNKTHFPFAELD